MASAKKTTEVAAPTIDELRATLATKRQDMLEAKRSNAAGELVNQRVITSTRKEIARLLTAIRAAELAGKEEK